MIFFLFHVEIEGKGGCIIGGGGGGGGKGYVGHPLKLLRRGGGLVPLPPPPPPLSTSMFSDFQYVDLLGRAVCEWMEGGDQALQIYE